MSRPGIIHRDGILLFGTDGKAVNVTKLGLENGKMIPASNYGQDDVKSDIGDLSSEEQTLVDQIKAIWEAILHVDIEDTTDFFKSGAGSMDVTRLVEEIKEIIGE